VLRKESTVLVVGVAHRGKRHPGTALRPQFGADRRGGGHDGGGSSGMTERGEGSWYGKEDLEKDNWHFSGATKDLESNRHTVE